MSLQTSSELIGQIYDAAGDSSQWHELGLAISKATGARFCWLMMADPNDPSLCWVRSAVGRDRFDYQLDQGPWYSAVRATPPGSVVIGSQHADRKSVRHSPLYQDEFRPAGIQYAAMVVVERTAYNEHFFSLNRTPDQGDFGPDDERLLATIAPHLQRAYALHTRLYSPLANPIRLDPDLRDSPTGAFMLDRYGNIRQLNAAAEDILEQSDGVSVQSGKLHFEDSLANWLLSKDIEEVRISSALSDRPKNVDKLIRRCRRKSGRQSYVFSVVPQNPSLSCVRFDCAAATCVLVDDFSVAINPSIHSLENVFELTPAEARVAAGISRGMSVADIAYERGVSTHTVRSQLKQVLAKTGASSQSDLVRRTSALARVDQNTASQE